MIDKFADCLQVWTCGRVCCCSVPSLWCSLVLFILDIKFQVLSCKIICGSTPVSFPHLPTVDQLVVYLPSKILSHPKEKKLP